MSKTRYYVGDIPSHDDFGDRIDGIFYDSQTKSGQWAIMTPASWKLYRRGITLGTGYGQRYEKDVTGRFRKTDD